MPCFATHKGPLNGFLEKPKIEKIKPKPSPDKPKFCENCDYFAGYCRLSGSYLIGRFTEACDRAIPKQDKQKRKFFW